MESDLIELAADGVAVSPSALLVLTRVPGPPYPVGFQLIQGKQWPAVQLILNLGGHAVFVVDTTEPRLKQALREILGELS